MNRYILTPKELLKKLFQTILKFWLLLKHFLRDQFNKNVYTRILFTNIICFVACLTILIGFFDLAVKQVTYNQIQQELLLKAKRTNFALLQQDNLEWLVSSADKDTNVSKDQQEFLKFLSDIFDAKITIFDKDGNIVLTSSNQEIVPGVQVDKRFIKTISSGETMTTRITDREINELTFIAAVPMGDSNDIIVNGILLEVNPSNLDYNIIKMRLYLILGGILLLLIIIFISVYQAMHISKPIALLTASMAKLISGSYFTLEDDSTLDEFIILSDQFNKLSEKMKMIQEENLSVEEQRTRLFAEISHELRTPLTAVQGFVEAIQDGLAQDKDLLDRYLEIIYTQTIHINRLVDDMLQLSRLESGSISLEKLPLDLVTLAQTVILSIETMAQSKNTTVVFEKNTEHAMIMGDIDRIEQVIRNLLQNAINATENGEIKVKVESSSHDEIILTIKDNGIGISSEDLLHIWDRFYRSKTPRSNAKLQQGSGLGLVIVKQLVQLHDGKIDAESQFGIGTTFYVRFPALV